MQLELSREAVSTIKQALVKAQARENEISIDLQCPASTLYQRVLDEVIRQQSEIDSAIEKELRKLKK